MSANRVILGRVATLGGDSGYGWAQGIAIEGGRVAAVGPRAELAALIDAHTDVIELSSDQMAMPGITDAHLHLMTLVLAESQVERRLEHASRSAVLLGRVTEAIAGKELRRGAASLGQDVELYRERLAALSDERGRLAPATERTLRRRVACLNDAARADREVVRATRVLGASLAGLPPGDRTSPAASLRRWVVARLSSSDLPFFHEEIDGTDPRQFVSEFVAAARS